MTAAIPQPLSHGGARQALLLVETEPAPVARSRRQTLAALGYDTHLVALDQLHPARPRPARSRPAWLREDPLDALLARTPGPWDLVYLPSTAIAARTLHAIRRHNPAATVLLDAHDLCRHRSARTAALHARPDLAPYDAAHAHEEAALASAADAVLTTSASDALALRRAIPAAFIHAVPLILPLAARRYRSFADRRGLAFPVGGQAHETGAAWLVNTVMPLVWRQDPAVECLLVGPATPALHALAGPLVTILDREGDLARALGRVRLTIAPFRGGTGAAHALASIAARTPCLMTPTAAAGLDLPPGLRHLVADGGAALASRILHLHSDPRHHQATARAGTAWLRATRGETAAATALAATIGQTTPAAARA